MLVLAADQLSKYFVLQNLEPGVTQDVWGEALQFVLVFNPGAAFSLGEGVTWIFTIAMSVVAAAIVYLAATRVRSRLWAVVLGLLLGGVLGNLCDRLFRDPGFAVGHVVDFILTPWMWFWTPNAAIYNVADIFIVGGMASVALLLIIGIELDGSRVQKEKKAAGADAEAVDDSAAADAETTDAGAEPVGGAPDVAPRTGDVTVPTSATPDAAERASAEPEPREAEPTERDAPADGPRERD